MSRAFSLLLLICFASCVYGAEPDLPQFHVPGFEEDMRTLNDLHALHHDAAFTDCTLWDAWLPMATLWASEKKRAQYRAAFLNRRIDAEGYVSMQQHRGMAHSEGWPFPAWQQSTGAGFHFSTEGEPWAIQNFALKSLANTDGWEIHGAEVVGIDPVVGLKLKATGDVVSLTTPAFRCGTIVAPFARLEWAARGLGAECKATIEWLLEGEATWPANRAVAFAVPKEMQYANVPLYRQPGHAGLLMRYRVNLARAAGAEIDLKSIITAIDTRHPITNPNFVRGCCDYFAWTHDLDFLRQNIGRMRRALTYALREFRVREGKHVLVPWVGHDGRSGLVIGPDGKKSARPGLGVGNNYWDLLPFGAHDAIATMYLFDALQHLAQLERDITKRAEWNIPAEGRPFAAEDLTQLATEIRADFQTRFWNTAAGRFVGWIDVEGRAYDYGFTFVNLEAIHYGLASPEQAQSIFAWLDGRRDVAGDTSCGADIYRWRFAPRATTRRNVETYVWPWFNPEHIPWGGQVQDGGAVLGFSYYDLMTRLNTNGPDDAWKRLREILAWFREVQAEGGYRAYYAKPGRGTLQGGGPPGGLGLDQEFLESVLVPQVMLQGFLGFHATADSYEVHPRLPKDWPSLTIAGIRFGDQVLNITAHADGRVAETSAAADPEESATSTVTPASGAGSPAPCTLKITRLLHRLPAEQLALGRRMLVEGEPMPKEYHAENSWLILKDAGVGDTVPLYRCDINSGRGSALSRRSSHLDMTSQKMIGYIYTKPGPGLVELRLVIPKGTPREGYFVTDFTNCEGDAYREEEFLGYAYRTVPYDVVASVTPSTLVPGGTLEISWKTTYVPDGQKGRVNKFPDRILGVALSPAAVSGAFIDEEGKITGEPKTDPFARHVPLSGSFVWNSARSLSGEYKQKLPPGEYQIQFALFPACFYSHASPCELEDILFTASNVFTVADPTSPSNRKEENPRREIIPDGNESMSP